MDHHAFFFGHLLLLALFAGALVLALRWRRVGPYLRGLLATSSVYAILSVAFRLPQPYYTGRGPLEDILESGFLLWLFGEAFCFPWELLLVLLAAGLLLLGSSTEERVRLESVRPPAGEAVPGHRPLGGPILFFLISWGIYLPLHLSRLVNGLSALDEDEESGVWIDPGRVIRNTLIPGLNLVWIPWCLRHLGKHLLRLEDRPTPEGPDYRAAALGWGLPVVAVALPLLPLLRLIDYGEFDLHMWHAHLVTVLAFIGLQLFYQERVNALAVRRTQRAPIPSAGQGESSEPGETTPAPATVGTRATARLQLDGSRFTGLLGVDGATPRWRPLVSVLVAAALATALSAALVRTLFIVRHPTKELDLGMLAHLVAVVGFVELLAWALLALAVWFTRRERGLVHVAALCAVGLGLPGLFQALIGGHLGIVDGLAFVRGFVFVLLVLILLRLPLPRLLAVGAALLVGELLLDGLYNVYWLATNGGLAYPSEWIDAAFLISVSGSVVKVGLFVGLLAGLRAALGIPGEPPPPERSRPVERSPASAPRPAAGSFDQPEGTVYVFRGGEGDPRAFAGIVRTIVERDLGGRLQVALMRSGSEHVVTVFGPRGSMLGFKRAFRAGAPAGYEATGKPPERVRPYGMFTNVADPGNMIADSSGYDGYVRRLQAGDFRAVRAPDAP